MTGVGFTPSRAVGAEDIRDLQGGASHRRRLSRRGERQILQGAFHLASERGGDVAIAGGVLDLLMSQEHWDDADVLVVLEPVGVKGVTQRMQ